MNAKLLFTVAVFSLMASVSQACWKKVDAFDLTQNGETYGAHKSVQVQLKGQLLATGDDDFYFHKLKSNNAALLVMWENQGGNTTAFVNMNGAEILPAGGFRQYATLHPVEICK